MQNLKLFAVALGVAAPSVIASAPDINRWVVSDPPPADLLETRDLQELPMCNGQYYDPLQYTCFGDKQLCPWQDGFPQDRCGDTMKCYLPFRYDCSNGQLLEIPPATGPFELVAINLRNLAYVKVKACSNKFWLMEGNSCTLCPEKVGDNCPPGKDTVLLPGRNMATLVPGGQRYFVDPKDGALGFSVPHSGVDPKGAIYDFLILEKGIFAVWPGARGWMACPGGKEETDTFEEKWQIRAQLPAIEFEEECVPVNLITKPWKAEDGSNTTIAAWEYI